MYEECAKVASRGVIGMDNKPCDLDETKICDSCGECERCDLDEKKKCDNCMKCVMGEENYRTLTIDDAVLPVTNNDE